ncbi:MAG: carbohydrate-binding protein [Patescibacteria group bacterium]|nr:carbohydrate-binding protein [Patescibacteria group bacterium]
MSNNNTKKKLSIRRLFILFALVILSCYAVYMYIKANEGINKYYDLKPWYGAYVDVTAKPLYGFEKVDAASNHKNVILSFIVASKNDPCEPTWGTYYTLDDANNELDLDRRIARFRQLGGEISVSFGGLLNEELALVCKDEEKLLSAYKKVISRYQVNTLDFDLEGNALLDQESLERRARVVSKLQRQEDNKMLAVWLTLPVATFGLTEEGAFALEIMLKNNVDVTGVNIMTMNFGNSKSEHESMFSAAKRSVIEAHRQLGVIYNKFGITLGSNTLWKKIGLTVMIGQNDIPKEIFTLDDAKSINHFAKEKGVSRVSIWSANRDSACGDNYVNLRIVSDSCSGIKQEKHEFSKILSDGFANKLESNLAQVTLSETVEDIIDNPNESPYPIWNEKAVYLEGSKVVWRKNVYKAKWWTKGDLPDNPVLHSWQTPWELLGPVLPGEKPVSLPKLPENYYPEWDGKKIYNKLDRVMYEGEAYQAKWWTQGDSPEASKFDPDSSPWRALSVSEIEEILQSLKN